MDQFELIRTASRVYGKSIREIRRETGHHRTTIRKALGGKEPKYRRQKEPRAPVMDPVAKIIERRRPLLFFTQPWPCHDSILRLLGVQGPPPGKSLCEA